MVIVKIHVRGEGRHSTMTSESTRTSVASFRPFRALQVCLGVLLLTATGLKTHQLATEPVLERGILDSRWFLIAVVELVLALWVVSTERTRRDRVVLSRKSTPLILAACSGIVFAVGCGSSGPPSQLVHGASRHEKQSVSEIQGGLGTREVPSPSYMLVWDLGVLPPGSVASETFEIVNTTPAAWTLDHFEAGCGCTVPSISSRVVSPRKPEYIEVRYKAGNGTYNVAKTVVAVFREVIAPRVRILIRGKVRNQMTPDQEEVLLTGVHCGTAVQEKVLIENFSERRWNALKATECPEWLDVAFVESEHVKEENHVCQVWDAVLRADVSELDQGRYNGVLRIQVVDELRVSACVRVHLVVEPTVQLVPQQLFFGQVSPGQKKARKIRFLFCEGTQPSAKESIRVDHELGDRLELRWSSMTGRVLEMTALLTPGQDLGYIDSLLTVEFQGCECGPLRIPVVAKVGDNAS